MKAHTGMLYVKFFLCMIIFFPVTLSAQYNGNKSCFGDSAGIYFSNGNLQSFTSSVESRGSCVSVSDVNDSVLLSAYTRAGITGNTTLIKNRFNKLVSNGSNIVGEGWAHELQLIPAPNNDSLIYLFSIGVAGSSSFGLYYSIINYKINNDSGIVTQKNIQLLSNKAVDGLIGIKNANGKNW